MEGRFFLGELLKRLLFFTRQKVGERVELTALIASISAAAALSGIALGWIGRSRTVRQDVAQQASADTSLKVDVEYIKRGIDDIRDQQRHQGREIEKLAERVTRVEESAKQAHKRLDRIDDEN